MRRSTIIWILLIATTLGSMALANARLSGLASLPAVLGPELRVRSTSARPKDAEGAQTLKRGDHIVAVRERAVNTLPELRLALLGLPERNTLTSETDGSRQLLLPYRLVRPLHRFNLTLSGEPLDPESLPPGVEEGDMLVKLNGRPMVPKVSTEGLRSIVSSRPEALLVLERRNASFTGELKLDVIERPTDVIVLFALVVLLLVALWRARHETLNEQTPLSIGAQTICLAWGALLTLQAQWVMADPILGYGAIFGMVLTRPLGIVGRSASSDGPINWGALGLGVLGGAFVCGALYVGQLSNIELALQLAAVLTGFFLVFEIVLTGLNEGAGVSLGERSIFLAGLIAFVLLSGVVAFSLDPMAFREERWRWFISVALAIMWFGDVLLCFRGTPPTPFEELSTSEKRREQLLFYLLELSQEFPHTEFVLVAQRDADTMVFTPGLEGLSVEEAPEMVHDTIAIMLQEGGSVPGHDTLKGQLDPLQGIAESMDIVLALVFAPPKRSMTVEGIELALLGFGPDEGMRDSFAYEDLDFVQHRLTPTIWGAGIIEAVTIYLEEAELEVLERAQDDDAPRLASEPDDSVDEDAASPEGDGDGEAEDERDHQLAELTDEVGELRETTEMLREDRRQLALEVETLRKWHKPLEPLPPDFDVLLEPELIDALRYLAKGEAPVVFAGASGAGKTFIARAMHAIEERPAERLVAYDPSRYRPEDHLEHLFGGEGDLGVLHVCEGGSLVIERADFLSDDVLLELLEHAGRARVMLCFTLEDAEERSALDGADPDLVESLGERELVVPGFARRKTIQRDVLFFLFQEAAFLHDRSFTDISPSAMNALLGYAYPGHLAEARVILDLAVRQARSDFLEPGDLPADVRRGGF